MTSVTITKPVFGLFQGTKNRKAKLLDVKGKEGLAVYQLTGKDDDSFCLEKEGTLYRICAAYQEKSLLQLIQDGSVISQISGAVDRGIEALNSSNKKVRADANLWYLCGKDKEYQQLLTHNKTIDQNKDREKQEEQEKAEGIELERFNKENPYLSDYRQFLVSSGKTPRGVASTIKALLKLNSWAGNVATRANQLLNQNKTFLSVDSEAMRFYINSEGHFYDIQTKSELGFALWIIENNHTN